MPDQQSNNPQQSRDLESQKNQPDTMAEQKKDMDKKNDQSNKPGEKPDDSKMGTQR